MKKLNLIIKSLFYKDGEFSWWKSIQNILLIYVVSNLTKLYYYVFYNPSVPRFYFDFQGSAIGIILASILCYSLIFIIFIFSSYCFQNTTLKTLIKLFNFTSFIVILFFYGLIVNICGNPICFLNLFAFPTVVLAFILIFKKSKYFTPFFVILFLIPSSIIITDDWMSAPSYKDCKQDILNASFSPITLPATYFHQDNGKTIWQPNIIFPVDLNKEYKNKILYISSLYCSEGKIQLRKKYKENNIILCVYKGAEKFTISTFDENKQILVDLKFTKFNRKRNDLDLILHTTKGEYSCAEKLSTEVLIKYLPSEKYLHLAE